MLGAGALLAAAGTAGAQDCPPGETCAYVRQDGVTGTWTYPDLTAAVEASTVEGFRRILVYPGYYRENLDVTQGGLTIESVEGPLLTCIDGSGSSQSNDAVVTVVGTLKLTLIGLNLSGSGYGVLVPNSADVSLYNCVIEGNAVSGIYAVYSTDSVAATRLLAQNCVVKDNRGPGILILTPNCFSNSAPPSPYITLRNCIIIGNELEGVRARCNNGIGPYNHANVDRFVCRYNIINGNSAPFSFIPNWVQSNNNTTESAGFVPSTAATGCGTDVRLRQPTTPGGTGGSFAINNGFPGAAYLDPDGSRNDIGAFGGPYAAGYFGTNAPVVRDVQGPLQINVGDGEFTINAKGATR